MEHYFISPAAIGAYILLNADTYCSCSTSQILQSVSLRWMDMVVKIPCPHVSDGLPASIKGNRRFVFQKSGLFRFYRGTRDHRCV